MSEEAIYKLHRYPSGELEEFEYVQDLVRCKECKYRFQCRWNFEDTNPDGFCSYGERRWQ